MNDRGKSVRREKAQKGTARTYICTSARTLTEVEVDVEPLPDHQRMKHSLSQEALETILPNPAWYEQILSTLARNVAIGTTRACGLQALVLTPYTTGSHRFANVFM